MPLALLERRFDRAASIAPGTTDSSGVRASMSARGTFVWTGRALQAECEDLEMIGLALLYPALERSICAPGHHVYPRTSDLILRKALKGR